MKNFFSHSISYIILYCKRYNLVQTLQENRPNFLAHSLLLACNVECYSVTLLHNYLLHATLLHVTCYMLHCYIDIRSGERGADDPLIHFARILTQRFPHPVIPANRERGTKGRISSNKW